jgi:hypothetical protein
MQGKTFPAARDRRAGPESPRKYDGNLPERSQSFMG